jgi:hypothetical protein
LRAAPAGTPSLSRGVTVGSEDEQFTLRDSFGQIETQQTRGYKGRPDEGDNLAPFEAEMSRPIVGAWIEQEDWIAGAGIQRGYVRAFGPIAENAGISGIFGLGTATMFSADDVVNLMPEARVRLKNETVLTAKACPPGDFGAETIRYLAATGEDQPGLGFGQSDNVFKLHEVIEFRGFVRGESGLLPAFDEVRNASLCFS